MVGAGGQARSGGGSIYAGFRRCLRIDLLQDLGHGQHDFLGAAILEQLHQLRDRGRGLGAELPERLDYVRSAMAVAVKQTVDEAGNQQLRIRVDFDQRGSGGAAQRIVLELEQCHQGRSCGQR